MGLRSSRGTDAWFSLVELLVTVAVLTTLAGMAVLMGLDAVLHLRFRLGELLAIGASVAYATYLLTTQRARVHVDTLTFMTYAGALDAL